MVLTNLPQSTLGNLKTNTNYPPEGQLSGGGVIPPAFLAMLFETGETMLYEDVGIMEYEAANAIPADWFDVSFKKRVPITINAGKITGTRTDFNMMIDSVIESLKTNTEPNGEDIRFADTSKVEIPYDRDEFDRPAGSLLAWLKFNATSNQKIYLYFDKPGASDGVQPLVVWSNHDVVYHMSETAPAGVGAINNSAGASNDGTATGTLNSVANEKIGKGLLFNGTDTNISYAGVNLGNTFNITFWLKSDSTENISFDRLYASTGDILEISLNQPTNEISVFTLANGWQTAGNLGGGNSKRVTLSKNSTTIFVFVDGIQTFSIGSSINVPLNTTLIGARVATSSENVGVLVSEFKVQSGVNVTVTNEAEDFDNQNNPNAFYTVGAVETI